MANSEIQVWCQQHWDEQVPEITAGRLIGGALSFDLLEMVMKTDEFAQFSQSHPGEHQLAVRDFLALKPACCRLGSERLRQLAIDCTPERVIERKGEEGERLVEAERVSLLRSKARMN